jgi:hypothetical protein
MWYLLFPDVGLAIELAHGVGVSWDGRVHRHCTAVPRHVALRDHLYCSFFVNRCATVGADKLCLPRRRQLRGRTGGP